MTSDRKTSYTSNSQQRLLKVIKALSGNEFHGLTPGELAQAVRVQPAKITRDLQNLKEAGFVEEVPELGRWRLGPAVVQLGLNYMDRRNSTFAKMNELDNRYRKTV